MINPGRSTYTPEEINRAKNIVTISNLITQDIENDWLILQKESSERGNKDERTNSTRTTRDA